MASKISLISQTTSQARLKIADAVINGIIDLHSSDEVPYLEIYQKLRCHDNLVRVCGSFGAEINTLTEGTLYIVA